MGKLRSIWHSLVRGLGWGIFIALLNSPVFPTLLEVFNLIDRIRLGKEWTGLFGTLAPEIWLIFFIFGLTYLSAPSIVGGGVLAFALSQLMSANAQPERIGARVGAIVGTIVTLSGLFGFFSEVQPISWTFLVVAGTVWIWEMVLFVWAGRRLVLSYPPSNTLT